jgi:hypothetical protein
MNKIIGPRGRATKTRPCHIGTTIQQELHGKINFIAIGIPSNLDSIGQGSERGMSPASPTVLRNVLIETVCQKGSSVHISPKE